MEMKRHTTTAATIELKNNKNNHNMHTRASDISGERISRIAETMMGRLCPLDKRLVRTKTNRSKDWPIFKIGPRSDKGTCPPFR